MTISAGMRQVEALHRNRDRILFHLKARGEQTAASVGARFGMTPAGARQHLVVLAADGLVESEDRTMGRGRPRKFWRLTTRGHGRFPDRHSDLTVDLLAATHSVFGERGLNRLIRHREQAMMADYGQRIQRARSLREKLKVLAERRSGEGYMASVTTEKDGSFLLIEDHCPICAAAEKCQGLCRSELSIFRSVLGSDVEVERIDHILAGARRCAYRICKRN
jgi:predicted ArsR family transcriptional regulator